MIVLEYKNEEIIKKKIADKDKIKLKYKQRLNLIKQHYGVEFDVEHLNNNEVENIRFINLKYKLVLIMYVLITTLVIKK